jgi:hypothetical protein
VRNAVLMRLLANVCEVAVVLPGGEGGEGSVGRGAAMLGRFATEVKDGVDEKEAGELLWSIMVSSAVFSRPGLNCALMPGRYCRSR